VKTTLIVEDCAMFARPIATTLEAQNHKAAWFVGITYVDKDKIVGITPGPKRTPRKDFFDGEPDRLCQIETKKVGVCLIDGNLVSKSLDGCQIARLIAEQQIAGIAITFAGAGNKPLLAAGALMGLPKELVVKAILQGLLPEEVLKDRDAAAVKLAAFVAQLTQERVEASKGKRDFDFGFPLEEKELLA
jgi:hypothetical protein